MSKCQLLITQAKKQKDQVDKLVECQNYNQAISKYIEILNSNLNYNDFKNQSDYQIMQEFVDTSNQITKSLCECYLKNKDYTQCIIYSNQILRQEPENIQALFNKAISLNHLKQFQKAYRTFSQIQQISLRKNQPLSCEMLEEIKENREQYKMFRASQNIMEFDDLEEERIQRKQNRRWIVYGTLFALVSYFLVFSKKKNNL